MSQECFDRVVRSDPKTEDSFNDVSALIPDANGDRSICETIEIRRCHWQSSSDVAFSRKIRPDRASRSSCTTNHQRPDVGDLFRP